MIRTVLGDINKEDLGVTSAHEHVLSDLRPLVAPTDNPDFYLPFDAERRYQVNEDPYNVLDNALVNSSAALEDLKIFKKFGGDAIAEVTTDDFGRDPNELKRLSEVSGVKIIMGCGHYVDASISAEDRAKSVDALANEIINDVKVGVRGSGVKSGVIGEIGTSLEITETEWNNVRAAAIAAAETGAGIHFHTALWGRNGGAIIDETARFGVSPEKVCIDHIDVDLRMDYVLELLDKGVYVEFDNIGKEFYVPKNNRGLLSGRFAYDLERANIIAELVKKGFADQILLSNDICLKNMLIPYGGNGYAHLLRHFIPMLRDVGISAKDTDKMLRSNPAEFLDIKK